MAKVTGIGGVFFKATGDQKTLLSWYQNNLGFDLQDFVAILNWQLDTAEDKGLTVWTVAEKDSDWFEPSHSSFMINYRIDDMDGMITQLKANGVEILKGPEAHENGKYTWIMDPDGNKVELWEPKIWDNIKTTEDFIARSASRSMLSGRSYNAHCPGKEPRPVADWLKEELERFRKDKTES